MDDKKKDKLNNHLRRVNMYRDYNNNLIDFKNNIVIFETDEKLKYMLIDNINLLIKYNEEKLMNNINYFINNFNLP